MVQGFRVAGWLRGLRDGAKSTIRTRRGQAPQSGAARRAAGRHHDRIDRIDRVALLRSEAREAERGRLGRVGRASSLSKGRARGRLPRKAFVDLFDWRASEGDKWPGSVAFRNCTAGEGLGALLGCSTIKANGHLGRDKDPTKVLDFVFEGNSLAPGAVERAELPRRR